MINVVGLGYIGLPTALMFAAHGVEVVGTDINYQHGSFVKSIILTGGIFPPDFLAPSRSGSPSP